MEQNKLADLSDEQLLKRRNVLKGASIGLCIVFVLIVATFIYLFATRGFKVVPFAAMIPVFIMPVTFMPLMINLSMLNKEVKSRGLE